MANDSYYYSGRESFPFQSCTIKVICKRSGVVLSDSMCECVAKQFEHMLSNSMLYNGI